MNAFHYFKSLWHCIPQGGPLNVFVQAANLGVFLYVLSRVALAWGLHLRLPRSPVLISLSLVPIILSTTLAIIYLSELPTQDQLNVSLADVPEEAATADPTSDGGLSYAIMLVDLVRLNLYSGWFFTALSFVAVYAIRLLKFAEPYAEANGSDCR